MGDISLSFFKLTPRPSSSASLGILADLIFFSISSMSAPSSPSPSSFLNGFDLLVQVEVALVLLHLALDATADLLVDVEDINLTLDLLKQFSSRSLTPDSSRTACLLSSFKRQVRSDGIGQRPGSSMLEIEVRISGGNLLVQFDVLVKLLHHRAPQRLDLSGFATRLVAHAPPRPASRWRNEVQLAVVDFVTTARCCPSTSTLTVPSGNLSICRMVEMQPTPNMSVTKGRPWRQLFAPPA
jgi:hypothetical protein